MQKICSDSYSGRPQDWYLQYAVYKDWDSACYEFVKVIQPAKRNQGYVAECKDNYENRLCAIKLVPLGFLEKAERTNDTEQPLADAFTARYMSEVVGSPHFLKAYGCSKDDATQTLYIVWELAAKGDLINFINDSITGKRVLTPVQYFSLAKHYAFQALQGLAELHHHHIAHGDISPENVVVREDDSVALIDLGMSQKLTPAEPGSSSKYLPLQRWRGKRSCTPPEVSSGSYDGQAADVFAMGYVILATMTFPAISSFPWKDARPGSMCHDFTVFAALGLAELLKRKKVEAFVDPQLFDLLNSMLSLDPSKRPTALKCTEHPWFSVAASTNTTVAGLGAA